MTTILACDVLPDMVIRTALVPERSSEPTAVATFRVASVDGRDGTIRIHVDSPSSRIFEIPDYVQVQVLQWPTYAHEVVVTDPEVMESCREDPELEVAAPSVGDDVADAVERVLRRQQSKGQHPSNGGK